MGPYFVPLLVGNPGGIRGKPWSAHKEIVLLRTVNALRQRKIRAGLVGTAVRKYEEAWHIAETRAQTMVTLVVRMLLAGRVMTAIPGLHTQLRSRTA